MAPRDQLASIWHAGVAAVEPGAAVRAHLRADGDGLATADGWRWPGRGRVVLLAVGKAAVPMAAAALPMAAPRLMRSLVVSKDGHGRPPTPLELLESAHPVPDARSMAAGERLLTLVAGLSAEDLVLLCLSGGASALAEAPAGGLTLTDLQAVTRALLAGGVAIGGVNSVRKHCSRLKGGRLAQAARPAAVLTLALSDVPGDDWSVIGSGPTAPDPGSRAEALALLDALPDRSAIPLAVRRQLAHGEEAPKAGDPCFAGSHRLLVGSNAQAIAAAMAAARRLGFSAAPWNQPLAGEASLCAEGFAAALRAAPPGTCLVAGGETTVTLGPAPGRGGRNQEFALACARALDGSPGCLVLAAGTDGTDGPTDAAGGFADGGLWRRAAAAGCDPVRHLAGHDALPLLSACDALFAPGPTGTNVMDLVVGLRSG